MKKSNSTSSYVAIPSTTLNALKQMLFSADKGVDLSSIIEDLTADLDNADLTAINVALVFKGIKPEIDRTPRYGDLWESNNSFRRYDVLDYSLIKNVVKCRVTFLYVSPDGVAYEDEKRESDEIAMSYDKFLDYEVDANLCISRILDYREKHK